MAQAFANMHGGDGVKAYSAGSRPSGKVNPKAIKAMEELGYDLSTHESKSMNDYRDIEMDAVVTMGCGDECPWVPAHKHIEWEIPDPRHMEGEQFNVVRDLVQSKVTDLLNNL